MTAVDCRASFARTKLGSRAASIWSLTPITGHSPPTKKLRARGVDAGCGKPFGVALVKTLEQVMGERLTLAERNAWDMAYAFITAIMVTESMPLPLLKRFG